MKTLGSWCLVLCMLLPLLPARAESTPEELLLSAIGLYHDSRFEDAEAQFRRIDPSALGAQEQSRLYLFRGLNFAVLEREHEATESFVDLLAIEPDFDMSQERFGPRERRLFDEARKESSSALYDRAHDLYLLHRDCDALAYLEQARDLDVTNPSVDTLINLVQDRLDGRDCDQLPPPPCIPAREELRLSARTGSYTEDVDWTSRLRLPAKANRVTLEYQDGRFGADECWKIYLYGLGDSVVHSFQGTGGQGAIRERTDVQTLGGVREVQRVVVHAGSCTRAQEESRRRNRDEATASFVLTLEVVCPGP